MERISEYSDISLFTRYTYIYTFLKTQRMVQLKATQVLLQMRAQMLVILFLILIEKTKLNIYMDFIKAQYLLLCSIQKEDTKLYRVANEDLVDMKQMRMNDMFHVVEEHMGRDWSRKQQIRTWWNSTRFEQARVCISVGTEICLHFL